MITNQGTDIIRNNNNEGMLNNSLKKFVFFIIEKSKSGKIVKNSMIGPFINTPKARKTEKQYLDFLVHEFSLIILKVIKLQAQIVKNKAPSVFA